MQAAGLAGELTRELYRGVVDGIREAREEAPHVAYEAALREPNYSAMDAPIEIVPLPPGVLGATHIDQHGRPHGVRISSYIAAMGAWLANKYRKSADWAKQWVYDRAKLTTEHELNHVLSSYVAKGEDFNENTRDVMETVTTYAMHKAAKRRGKHGKAEMIKQTNPYPVSWRIGTLADKYYEGGYRGFMHDAQSEPFYRPLWRLGKAVAKKAPLEAARSMGRKIGVYKGTGVPAYVPA